MANAEIENHLRYVNPDILLSWIKNPTPYAVVENRVDALPNGLSLKMAPFIVNWNRSELDDPEQGYYLIHNVNIGGNPVRGTSNLATVKVPLNAVESVEFVHVRDRKDGEEKMTGHGQLRFIFKPDRRPAIQAPLDKRFIGDRFLDDLIISYEAWRPPGVPFETARGLDPDAYALTVRCFSGSYNFLLSALKDKSWEAYPLQLPPVEGAADEIFETSLMMGDALARRVMDQMIQEGDLDKSGLVEWSAQDIEKAKDLFSREEVPDDPIQELVGNANLSYNLLLRSCITISLFNIDLAYQRIYDRHQLGERKRLKIVPEKLPDWIDDIPNASRVDMLTHLPGALLWIANNQTVIPANAYKILENADVLKTEGGKPIKYYYAPEAMTPYGALKENM